MSLSFSAASSERSMYEYWFTSHGGSLESNSITLEGAGKFFAQSGQSAETLATLIRITNRSKENSTMTFSDFCVASNLLLQLSRKEIDALPGFLPCSFFDTADQFSTIKKPMINEDVKDPFPNLSTTSPQRPPSTPNTPSIGLTGNLLGTTTATTSISTSSKVMPSAGFAGISKGTAEGSSSAVWAIPEEKQTQYATFFTSLDSTGKGFVTGTECFAFFVKSLLPQSELSKIWSMVTFDGAPQLKKEDFIVAMHLINEKLAGKPIPMNLPLELIPPSRRMGSGEFSVTHRPPSNESIVSIASFATPMLRPTKMMDDLTKSPLHEELKDLTLKTEQLTSQRMDLTHQVNALSIEKQNLSIKLGQAKATHEAETALVQSLKTTADQEKISLATMMEELQLLDKQRQGYIQEKQELMMAQQKYKTDAETFRHQIATMNTEIQTMRQELIQIKSVVQKDQENFDFFKQTAINVEDTKQRLQQQLKEAKETHLNRANLFTSPTSINNSPPNTSSAFATTNSHNFTPSSIQQSTLPPTTSSSPALASAVSALSPRSLPDSPGTTAGTIQKSSLPPEYQKDFDKLGWDFPVSPTTGTASTSTASTPAAKITSLEESAFDPFLTDALQSNSVGIEQSSWPDTKNKLKDLLDLGFTREQVMDAMQKYPEDISKASNYLFEESEKA